MILPYFQFPSAPDEEEKEMQAKVADFMLNTKSALDYYDKSGLLGDVFNNIYLVGDNDLTEMKEFSLGSNSQKMMHILLSFMLPYLLLISLTKRISLRLQHQ